MTKAIYAFSGDPITFGHVDIINRALKVFKELVVGIGNNPAKKYLFSLEERAAMARAALRHLPNVEVVYFKGLLVDYAYEHQIPTVIRGLRNSDDFNFELMFHQVGESQTMNIDTFFVPARQDMTHISSGAAQALQLEQGLIHHFVPLNVKQKLEERISKQYIIGITGEMGVGKSYLSEQFKQFGQEQGLAVHRIDIDRIGHELLEVLTEPIYLELRNRIINIFGKSYEGPDGFINSKALGKLLFSDLEKLTEFNALIYKPLILKLRRELYGKQGLILLDSALILESAMSYLCNNNLLLVSAPPELQKQRLFGRNYTEAQIKDRLASQYSHARKQELINSQIEQARYGTLWEFANSGPAENEKIRELFAKILTDLHIKKEN